MTVPAVVEQLAADGPRVVAAVDGVERAGVKCSPVYVWDRSTGRVDGYGDCWGPYATHWISEVAIAGREVAWVDVSVGNGIERTVFKATLAREATFDDGIAAAPGEGGGESGGDYVGHLYGRGSLLVFNAWKQCYPNMRSNEDYGFTPMCQKGEPPTSGEELKRLGRPGKPASTLARGRGVMPILSVGAGHIAVGGSGRQIKILRADGSVLRRVTLDGASARSAALAGSELAVLTPDALDLYSISSGTRLKSFPLSVLPAPQRKLAGLSSGYVAFVERTSIRVLRLSDSKSIRFGFHRARGPVRAQLTAGGLYYSYNDRQASQTGHLAYLPLSSLAARF